MTTDTEQLAWRVANEESSTKLCRILSLDGGGAKGFYTLGVLHEVEAMLGSPLCDRFDLVFGTSTGSIIASLICLGYKVSEIHDLYKMHVPRVTAARTKKGRSAALRSLAHEIYGTKSFGDVRTGIGIVSTRWAQETPMIFKASAKQAHGRQASFVPGFGVSIADAVQASCAAYPFFLKHTVTTSHGDVVELMDGGYCANNPTLYAMADAMRGLGVLPENLRVLSVGVGQYPTPEPGLVMRLIQHNFLVQLLQKTLEVNTQSMEQLRKILLGHVQTVRVSDTFQQPEMATDLLEHDLKKLSMLHQRGIESFGKHEDAIRSLF